MEKSVFATLKTMPAKWHETGSTIPVEGEVLVVAGEWGFSGVIRNHNLVKYPEMWIIGEPRYVAFTPSADVTPGEYVDNVEAFELKKETTGETIWRLRINK